MQKKAGVQQPKAGKMVSHQPFCKHNKGHAGSCATRSCCTAAGLPGKKIHNAVRKYRYQHTAGICAFATLVFPVHSSGVPDASLPARCLPGFRMQALSTSVCLRLISISIDALNDPLRAAASTTRKQTRTPLSTWLEHSILNSQRDSPPSMADMGHSRARCYP